MSRIKVAKRFSTKEVKTTEWPAVVYFWIIGLRCKLRGLRIVLDAYPHPYHWLFGLADWQASRSAGCGIAGARCF